MYECLKDQFICYIGFQVVLQFLECATICCMDKADSIIELTRSFTALLEKQKLDTGLFIYNPLTYAWVMHEAYLHLAVRVDQRVFFLGMNPGPYGMCQTGVPFGDVVSVKEYLHLVGNIEKPVAECPARPIEGLDTKRREMSGRRFWGAVRERYPEPADFFLRHTVFNYLPLCFLDEKGRNVTPDRLKSGDRHVLYGLCDKYLSDVLEIIKPRILVGVGRFAVEKLEAFAGQVLYLPHPSPLNRSSMEFYTGEKIKEFFNELDC